MSSKRAALDVGALRTSALGSASIWQRLRAVTETGSTNADLLAQAAAGENIAGSVLLAEFQTAGRGRQGRTWTAPPRSQIAMSVGVDVRDVPVGAWGWLPLLTGVAAVETLREQYGVDAGLKWPNDVMVDTGKLAGILAEAAGPVSVVVVGLGLNVGFAADEAPDPAAISLAMLGCQDVDRTELAATLLRALGTRVKSWRSHGGADPRLRADYLRYSRTIGTRVRALLPGDAELEGSATAVDEIGRLVIDDGTQTVSISAGDITHLRPARNA
jgi:BirA family biotin operon repressor/biotin-[acetyl-CoA-carboxylase] ligase